MVIIFLIILLFREGEIDMKVLRIICTVLACLNVVFAMLNLMMSKKLNDARKYYEDVAAEYEAKLKELEEEEPEARFIINDDDLPTETCTSDYVVGNFDA